MYHYTVSTYPGIHVYMYSHIIVSLHWCIHVSMYSHIWLSSYSCILVPLYPYIIASLYPWGWPSWHQKWAIIRTSLNVSEQARNGGLKYTRKKRTTKLEDLQVFNCGWCCSPLFSNHIHHITGPMCNVESPRKKKFENSLLMFEMYTILRSMCPYTHVSLYPLHRFLDAILSS